MARLLIVDDEQGYRDVLKTIFEADGYTVTVAPNGGKALTLLKSSPQDLIISDVRMPDLDGIGLLKEAREISPGIGVVLMSAFGTLATAREAFKLGADDFIQKPFNNEELKTIVKRTLEKQSIVHQNRAFRKAQRNMGGLTNIIGKSEKMTELYRLIETVACEESTILITGESGTGKELVARAVHDMSDRAKKPFIPVNCGALTETLLESELFGYVKGAFTGAGESRPGMFESANDGTIFLDEIGDMSLAMQVKILRVLQEQKVKRVGASIETPVDTRVIAATNRDLEPMVADGSFRRDLFYRVSVIPLQVPALRERREDVPVLAEHFIKKFSTRSGKKIKLGKDAIEQLTRRSWNGNVRELEHAIERCVALTPNGGSINPDHCVERASTNGLSHFGLPADGLNLHEYLHSLERDLVTDALSHTGGSQTRAAELLQMPVHALRHLLDKHSLR
jgi:two-component system response regulator PilR (NtrC family)